MNDREHRERRRRATSMTAIPTFGELARCCVELIDVLTRRQDLPDREDLVSVATSLRLLVPPGTALVAESDLLHLVEVFGVAMRVAGLQSNTMLPTVAELRKSGRSFPYPVVLESAACFFEWRSHEDANRHELVTAAIDVSRVCGLLTPPTSVWRDDAVLLRAAANVVAATRVAVALADPDPGSAYEVWLEESRMRRQVILDDVERSLAARRCHTPPDDMN